MRGVHFITSRRPYNGRVTLIRRKEVCCLFYGRFQVWKLNTWLSYSFLNHNGDKNSLMKASSVTVEKTVSGIIPFLSTKWWAAFRLFLRGESLVRFTAKFEPRFHQCLNIKYVAKSSRSSLVHDRTYCSPINASSVSLSILRVVGHIVLKATSRSPRL